MEDARADVTHNGTDPKSAASFIGLPPIRRTSAFGLTPKIKARRAQERFPLDDYDDVAATQDNHEDIAESQEDNTPQNEPSPIEPEEVDHVEPVPIQPPVPDGGSYQTRDSFMPPSATLFGTTSTYDAPPNADKEEMMTSPREPPLPPLPTQNPQNPQNPAQKMLPPHTFVNPIQHLPTSGPWKLEESHLAEPLHEVTRKRSGTGGSLQPGMFGIDKETGLPSHMYHPSGQMAPPPPPNQGRQRSDVPPSSAQRYPDLFAQPVEPYRQRGNSRGAVDDPFQPGFGAALARNEFVNPRAHTSEFSIPGVGPPEDDRGRRNRNSGVFKDLGQRLVRAASRERRPSMNEHRQHAEGYRGDEASESSVTTASIQEKRKSRTSLLFGLGGRSSTDQLSKTESNQFNHGGHPLQAETDRRRSRFGAGFGGKLMPSSGGRASTSSLGLSQDGLADGRNDANASAPRKKRFSGVTKMFTRGNQEGKGQEGHMAPPSAMPPRLGSSNADMASMTSSEQLDQEPRRGRMSVAGLVSGMLRRRSTSRARDSDPRLASQSSFHQGQPNQEGMRPPHQPPQILQPPPSQVRYPPAGARRPSEEGFDRYHFSHPAQYASPTSPEGAHIPANYRPEQPAWGERRVSRQEPSRDDSRLKPTTLEDPPTDAARPVMNNRNFSFQNPESPANLASPMGGMLRRASTDVSVTSDWGATEQSTEHWVEELRHREQELARERVQHESRPQNQEEHLQDYFAHEEPRAQQKDQVTGGTSSRQPAVAQHQRQPSTLATDDDEDHEDLDSGAIEPPVEHNHVPEPAAEPEASREDNNPTPSPLPAPESVGHYAPPLDDVPSAPKEQPSQPLAAPLPREETHRDEGGGAMDYSIHQAGGQHHFGPSHTSAHDQHFSQSQRMQQPVEQHAYPPQMQMWQQGHMTQPIPPVHQMQPQQLQPKLQAGPQQQGHHASASRWKGLRSRVSEQISALGQGGSEQKEQKEPKPPKHEKEKGNKLSGTKLLGAFKKGHRQPGDAAKTSQQWQQAPDVQPQPPAPMRPPRERQQSSDLAMMRMNRMPLAPPGDEPWQGPAPVPQPANPPMQYSEPRYDYVPIPRGYSAVHGEGSAVPSPYNVGRHYSNGSIPQPQVQPRGGANQQRSPPVSQASFPRQESISSIGAAGSVSPSSAEDRRMSTGLDNIISQQTSRASLKRRRESEQRNAPVKQSPQMSGPSAPTSPVRSRRPDTAEDNIYDATPRLDKDKDKDRDDESAVAEPSPTKSRPKDGAASKGLGVLSAELEDTAAAHERSRRLESQEEKIWVSPEDDPEYQPQMTATSYPGQEWNPYGEPEFVDLRED